MEYFCKFKFDKYGKTIIDQKEITKDSSITCDGYFDTQNGGTKRRTYLQ